MRRSALRALVLLALFALAVSAGFALSSTLGQQMMRREAERQLAGLLATPVQVESVRVRVRLGVEIVATGVRARWSPTRPDDPPGALDAQQVVARLSTPSLLLGRFGIDALRIDGLRIALRGDVDDRWSPPWFHERADAEKPPADRGSLEDEFGWMPALIGTAHLLLEELPVAHRVVLHDAAVSLVDRRPERRGAPPVELSLVDVEAGFERAWLGERSDVALQGRLLDPSGREARLELAGRKTGRQAPLTLTIAANDLELASVEPWLSGPSGRGELRGTLNGVVAVETAQPGRGHFEIDWHVRDLRAAIPLGEEHWRHHSPSTTARARLRLDGRRLTVEEAVVEGPSLRTRLVGSADRPLRPESGARLRASLEGLGLEDLRRLAHGLPEADRAPLMRLLERVENARIPEVSVRGRATLGEIGALLSGRATRLPEKMELLAAIEQVRVAVSERDRLEVESAQVAWSGDRFELREAVARLNDEPLARIDLAVQGVSTLFAAAPTEASLVRRARPLPGLGTLWRIVGAEPEGEGESPPPIEVTVHEFHHPALRWPIRDAVFFVDPHDDQMHVRIMSGHWAGAPVSGEAVLTGGSDPEIRIELRVQPGAEAAAPRALAGRTPPLPAEPASEAAPAAEPDDANTWASGRFRSVGMHGGPLRFEIVTGRFAVRGQTLMLHDVAASLEGGGTLSGSGSFALDREDAVQSAVEVELDDAEAGRVAAFFGLPPDFATGRADVRARLSAALRPDVPLLETLSGRIEIVARDGEVHQSVPLLAAIAHASEGLGMPRETLRYQRIDAAIDFDRGIVRSERIALDGPLRVLAAGSIDFRTEEAPIRATVGLFLLRQADRLLGNIPIVKLLLPGGDRGLIGAYFEVSGPVSAPRVTPMPIKSIAEGMPIPPVLRGPLRALGEMFKNDAPPRELPRSGALLRRQRDATS